jgi:ABC-type glycerol-3-phosphate transport system substrate-binding protein
MDDNQGFPNNETPQHTDDDNSSQATEASSQDPTAASQNQPAGSAMPNPEAVGQPPQPQMPVNPAASVVNQPPTTAGSGPEVGSTIPKAPQQTNLPRPKKKGFPVKIILIVLAVIFLIVLVAGVIYKLSSKPPAVGTPGEIVWWGVSEEESVVGPLIQEYQLDHPDLKIVYEKQSPQDYRVRLTNALASGKGPDMFEIHNSWTPMFVNQLYPLPSSVMSTDDYKNTFYPVIVKDMTLQKGIIGIPLFYDALTLYYNEDIFSLSAKVPPKTWDDLVELVDPDKGILTLRNDKGNIIQSGVALGLTENVDYWQDILALMMLQNGTSLAAPTDEAAGDALEFFKYFSDKGIWDTTLAESTIAFANGKVAMYFGPASAAKEILSLNRDIKFKTSVIPQLAKNKPTDPDVTYATYWVQGVSATSVNKDAAWQFINFLSEKSSIDKLNRGRTATQSYPLVSPRMDMAKLYEDDPIVGSITAMAPNADSWYLADMTDDGETGINTKVAELFMQAITSKRKPQDALKEIAPALSELLTQYGIRMN